MQQQREQQNDMVRRWLGNAREAIDACNAEQALQCVVQALKLLRGDDAVVPALRAAAERYHTGRAAPVEELSQLLAQVSLAAGQGMPLTQQQEAQPAHNNLQQHHQQHQGLQQMQWQQQQHELQLMSGQPPSRQEQLQQVAWQQHRLHQQQQQRQVPHHPWQQQQQQQQQPHVQQGHAPCASRDGSVSILEETGRGSFSEAALADGSSWLCPHCSGVVPVQRQQAHVAFWCPALQQAGDTFGQL